MNRDGEMVCAECVSSNLNAAYPYAVVGEYENQVRYIIEPGSEGSELIVKLAREGRRIYSVGGNWSNDLGWSPLGVTYISGTLYCVMHAMLRGTGPDRQIR